VTLGRSGRAARAGVSEAQASQGRDRRCRFKKRTEQARNVGCVFDAFAFDAEVGSKHWPDCRYRHARRLRSWTLALTSVKLGRQLPLGGREGDRTG
jgi:hypothetical protein